jgi:mono/diheme cytochrome c family protein
MGTPGNAVLGIAFWLIGLANTVLMFKLWGYPYDHERRSSAAPRSLTLLHRWLGYLFLGIYLYLMSQMVPRFWTYQVELPARTVAHLVMGIAVGILLVVKVLIVRFFRHLESTTAPLLGIAVLVCTTVLIGLSAPLGLREAYLARQGPGAGVERNGLQRLKALLPRAGLPRGVRAEDLATPAALARGRAVLLTACVQCHDLRTILVRPRTPEVWGETVRRMAERAVVQAIPDADQWRVTAYLIAISPDLQRSVLQQRKERQTGVPAAIVRKPAAARPTPAPAADPRSGETAFETTCNGCHALDQVEHAPPGSEAEARELVARMVENGLTADRVRLEQIIAYLAATYGR